MDKDEDEDARAEAENATEMGVNSAVLAALGELNGLRRFGLDPDDDRDTTRRKKRMLRPW